VLTGAPCYASSSSSVGSTSSSARRSCRTSPDLSHASRASPKRGPRGPANRGLLPYSPPPRIETDRDEADAGVGDAGSVEFRKLVPSSDDETDRDASRKTPSQHIRFPCTSATTSPVIARSSPAAVQCTGCLPVANVPVLLVIFDGLRKGATSRTLPTNTRVDRAVRGPGRSSSGAASRAACSRVLAQVACPELLGPDGRWRIVSARRDTPA
jgi:hypothetical protein